jgi:hypothetical protein
MDGMMSHWDDGKGRGKGGWDGPGYEDSWMGKGKGGPDFDMMKGKGGFDGSKGGGRGVGGKGGGGRGGGKGGGGNSSAGRSNVALRIHNIPETMTLQRILVHLKQFGEVSRANIEPLQPNDRGECKKEVIVQYKTPEHAKRFYHSPKSVCDNRFIKMEWASKEHPLLEDGNPIQWTTETEGFKEDNPEVTSAKALAEQSLRTAYENQQLNKKMLEAKRSLALKREMLVAKQLELNKQKLEKVLQASPASEQNEELKEKLKQINEDLKVSKAKTGIVTTPVKSVDNDSMIGDGGDGGEVGEDTPTAKDVAAALIKQTFAVSSPRNNGKVDTATSQSALAIEIEALQSTTGAAYQTPTPYWGGWSKGSYKGKGYKGKGYGKSKGRYGKGKGKSSYGGSSWYGASSGSSTTYRAATLDNRPTTLKVERSSCPLALDGMDSLDSLRKHFGAHVKEATKTEDGFLFTFKTASTAASALKRTSFQGADLQLAWHHGGSSSSSSSTAPLSAAAVPFEQPAATATAALSSNTMVPDAMADETTPAAAE